jgi:phosphoribosylglycinamide formyltransferase-1
LRHGAKFSGCTVHFADEGVDTGPIIIQAVVPVFDDDSEETLAARILTYEHQIYPRAIQLYAEGRLHVRGRHVSCRGSEADRPPREGWGYIHP